MDRFTCGVSSQNLVCRAGDGVVGRRSEASIESGVNQIACIDCLPIDDCLCCPAEFGDGMALPPPRHENDLFALGARIVSVKKGLFHRVPFGAGVTGRCNQEL